MSSMFGVKFPPGTLPNEVVSVHPTQLYEVLMGTIMFFIILRFRKHNHGDGWLFGFYCFLAGVDPYWQGTFVGIFIILAVLLERVRGRKVG